MGRNQKIIRKFLLSTIFVLCLTLFVPGFQENVRAAVRLSEKNITMVTGGRKRLTVKGTKKKVVWKSSNKKVATVVNGMVRAKKRGTARITAKVSGKTLRCKVVVKEKPTIVASTVVTGKNQDFATAVTVASVGSKNAYFQKEAYLVNGRTRTPLRMIDGTKTLESGNIVLKSRTVVRPTTLKKMKVYLVYYIDRNMGPMKVTKKSKIVAYFTYDGLKYKVTVTNQPSKASKVVRVG